MREIFTAPLKTSYHDNTTWFSCRSHSVGTWLKPRERVVVLTPEEVDLTEKVQSQFNVIVGQANEVARLRAELDEAYKGTLEVCGDANVLRREKAELRDLLSQAMAQLGCALDYMEGRTRVSFSGKQWSPTYLKTLLTEEKWEAGK